MNIFPSKSQLLSNFLSCISWEEKYMYIIDLGKSLPKFPSNMRTKEFLISNCQSQTWIVLIKTPTFTPPHILHSHFHIKSTVLYGDSDSAIVKGIISIIFIVYQELSLQSIIDFNAVPFLEQLQLTQNLTTSRSQGIYAILESIHIQARNIKQNIKNIKKSNFL